jgi:hypothetical protein
VLSFFLLALTAQVGRGQEKSEPPPAKKDAASAADRGYDYPELLVTPSAGERVAEEAAREKTTIWTGHIPLQVSALSTFMAGVISSQSHSDIEDEDKRDTAKYSALTAQVIGVGWLGTSVALGMMHKPYHAGEMALRKSKGSGKRDQLGKEREAEEVLSETASTYRKIKWLAVTSNFLAGLAVAGSAEDKFAQATGGIAALAALSPLLFPYRAETVDCYHQDYKKRIYGPLANLKFDFGISPGGGSALMASLDF